MIYAAITLLIFIAAVLFIFGNDDEDNWPNTQQRPCEYPIETMSSHLILVTKIPDGETVYQTFSEEEGLSYICEEDFKNAKEDYYPINDGETVWKKRHLEAEQKTI